MRTLDVPVCLILNQKGMKPNANSPALKNIYIGIFLSFVMPSV
jgi:hypothetical protein